MTVNDPDRPIHDDNSCLSCKLVDKYLHYIFSTCLGAVQSGGQDQKVVDSNLRFSFFFFFTFVFVFLFFL